MRFVTQLVKEHIHGKTLDAGSGTTYDVILTSGLENVIRIDKKKGKGIRQVDLNKIPFPFKNEEFDTVFCSHVLEHLDSPYLVLKEFKRILKPNGTLIIALPNPHFIFSQQLSKQEHINLICEKTMNLMLEKIGFEIIRKYRNWLFFKNTFFGRLCQYMPFFLQTDYWFIAERVK